MSIFIIILVVVILAYKHIDYNDFKENVIGSDDDPSEKKHHYREGEHSREDPPKSDGSESQRSSFAETFNDTFLALAAYVIKADDNIAQVELDRVEQYFKTYYPQNGEQYFERLQVYLRRNINIKDSCKNIADAEFNDKFQMMNQLFIIAMADEHIYLNEYVALLDIFNLLKLPNLTFLRIRNLFGVSYSHKEIMDFREQAFEQQRDHWRRENEEQRKQERRWQEQFKQQQSRNYYYKQHKQQRQKQQTFTQKKTSKIDAAYRLLGLETHASQNEIKKAYRLMAHKHHPDKVAHLGAGAVKQAELVFVKIKKAYDLIANS